MSTGHAKVLASPPQLNTKYDFIYLFLPFLVGPLSTARGPTKSTSNDDSTRWKAYGKILVLLDKTVELHDEITLRSFRVKHEDFPDVEHSVVQIHYTGWPDFGTPKNTQTFHQLLEVRTTLFYCFGGGGGS